MRNFQRAISIPDFPVSPPDIRRPMASQTITDNEEHRKDPALRIDPGCPLTILLMDDEESILEAFSRLLTLKGYTVIPARNGNEVIAIYRSAMERGDHIDVVILDLTVPGGMGGIETMEQLVRIDPAVRALATSGFSHDALTDYARYGFAGAIPKPYQWTDLVSAINRILMPE